jgi:two-component SAPR family response regulator
MLFASIFKYTPPSHPDYQNLERCLEKVKDINDEINEKKRIEDNKRKLFEVQTSIYAEHVRSPL